MGALLVYSIKSGMILTIMFAVYMLLMSRRKCAELRRLTLLSIYICALVLPIIMTYFSGMEDMNSLPVANGQGMDVRALIPLEMSVSYSWIYGIMAWIMVTGMSVVTLYSLFGITMMLRRCLRGRKVEVFGHTITVVKGDDFSPFSFWGRIYVSEGELSVLSAMVVCHESSHVAHRHYLDLVLGRIVAVAQWWNPLVWLMMREIRAVHEFQADMDVVGSGFDRREYQYMLLERVTGKRLSVFANGLGNSKLKARIMMMETENSRLPVYVTGLVVISAALASALFLSAPTMASVFDRLDTINAFQSFHDNDSGDTGSGKTVIHLDSVQAYEASGKPAVMVDGKLIDYETMSSLDPGRIKSIEVVKSDPEYPDGIIYVHLLGQGETRQHLRATQSMDSVRVVSYGSFKKLSR